MRSKPNQYLFILCPPYSGSTVLWQLVGTSYNSSLMPNEGQFLPELRSLMRKTPWEKTELPWEYIKSVWNNYWDHKKPILVEKSPSHLIRTDDIVLHFPQAAFLIMVRNPYAHCEGMMKHHDWDADKAANFVALTLKEQMGNVKKLDNSIHFTYEAFTENPKEICYQIQQFLPELGDLDYSKYFTIHSVNGKVRRQITNLNQQKIIRLSLRNINKINHILKNYSKEMQFWEYEYYYPGLRYFFKYWYLKVIRKIQRIIRT